MPLLTQSNQVLDQEKYLASKLIENTLLKLVCTSICDPVELDKGKGLTANFVRYRRMNVPVATLTEGVDPASSTFSLDTVTVVPDQWGDILEVTDVAELTAKHPLVTQMLDLLSDNAQRVIDREVQIVWLAGTNVQFGDGTVATRRTVTPALTLNVAALLRARVNLVDGGAPPRTGPSSQGPVNNARVAKAAEPSMYTQGGAYVAICGPHVTASLFNESAVGGWTDVHKYNHAVMLYNYEVGQWLGFRFVESNFVPKFTLYGNNTPAVATGNSFGAHTPVVSSVAGGSLAAVSHSFKVTRKDLTRGFEEVISIEHTITPTATHKLRFDFSAVTGNFVHNVYIGTSAGDANMRIALTNIASGAAAASAEILSVPVSGATAPDNILATAGPAAVHPVFIHGAGSTAMVKLQNLRTYITSDQSVYGNILQLKKAVGYKFMMKAMIKNQERVLRVEVASAQG